MSTSTLIVGAGISGLATAHFLRRQWGPDADITVLEASPHLGGKINTVPAAASFTIDRRVLPNENVRSAEHALTAFLKSAARKIPQCRITVSKISDNFSCYRPPNHPLFAALQASVSRIRRRPTKFMVSTGFNDMHFFAQVKKIPTVGYGPGGVDYHGVDERARVKDLVDSAKIYADLLTTFQG